MHVGFRARTGEPNQSSLVRARQLKTRPLTIMTSIPEFTLPLPLDPPFDCYGWLEYDLADDDNMSSESKATAFETGIK